MTVMLPLVFGAKEVLVLVLVPVLVLVVGLDSFLSAAELEPAFLSSAVLEPASLSVTELVSLLVAELAPAFLSVAVRLASPSISAALQAFPID